MALIIDADAHVSETPELFERFLDRAFPQPRLIKADMWGQGWWDFGTHTIPRRDGPGRGPLQGYAAGPERNDVALRQRFLDDEGIDVQVLYPTSLVGACGFADAAYASAL